MHRGGSEMNLKGRRIYKGKVTGEALVTSHDISFYGGCDPETGEIVEKGHELEGKSVTGKVLVFPTGKGSTVGSYVLYALSKAGKAPLAIINKDTDPVIAVGSIISGIPTVDNIAIDKIKNGQKVEVDADNGVVSIEE
jgi:predicted aconitase with swiveling domain